MKKYRFDDATNKALESLCIPFAVYQLIDKRIVTVLLSDGFCDLFGFKDKSAAIHLMDHNMYRGTHPDDKARIAEEALRFAKEGGKYESVYRTHTLKDSGYIIVHAIGRQVCIEKDVKLCFTWYTDEGVYTEENDGKNATMNAAFGQALREKSIINSGYFDYLTGLPTMSYFFELASQWRRGRHKDAALLYLNFCGMKYFNRTHGFAEGDKLLRRFADILKAHFSNENCSRFGSDHFCVYTEAEGLENKLREIFSEFRSDKSQFSIPVRVGIYLESNGTLDVSTECDRAKYACDTMRNTHVSGFRYFNKTMLATAEKHQYFIDYLDKAISEHWIQVYYQPLIRSANERVCGEEALARWVDPVRGIISPSEFIPILEETNLIYKLDLCVLEQVLQKIKKQKEAGLFVVPHSINLSRSDFNACDMVEEICRRVDEAGVSHNMLNIELTESTVGKDFEFMKSQIDRFRSLGFHVWLDDFGTGYSALDMLQSLRIDVIKFDMRFMHDFNNGDKSRIILTELMRMAISLDIDTLCEGVETNEQVVFLCQIGCTMMQGYYFCCPIPMEKVFERYEKGIQIGFENPDESDYYAAIGKINLYDLAILSNEDEEAFEHYFNTIPMAILETTDKGFELLRCNNSYRGFLEKQLGYLPIKEHVSFEKGDGITGKTFLNALQKCSSEGTKQLIDEELPDGSILHSFVKRIAVNPVNGTKAVAVALLTVSDAESAPVTFTHIAKALSSDYISLYYVNIKTGKYVEYSSQLKKSDLAVESRGNDFFKEIQEKILADLYPEDIDVFTGSFTKDNLIHDIEAQGVYASSYRMMIDNAITNVTMKAVRMYPNSSHIIIGVSKKEIHAGKK